MPVVASNRATFHYVVLERSLASFAIDLRQDQVSAYALQMLPAMVWVQSY